jgi:hypothetical protein
MACPTNSYRWDGVSPSRLSGGRGALEGVDEGVGTAQPLVEQRLAEPGEIRPIAVAEDVCKGTFFSIFLIA